MGDCQWWNSSQKQTLVSVECKVYNALQNFSHATLIVQEIRYCAKTRIQKEKNIQEKKNLANANTKSVSEFWVWSRKGIFYPLGKNYIRQTTVGLYDPESSIEMENAELGGIDCCSVCQAQSSLKVRELLTWEYIRKKISCISQSLLSR